MTMNKLDWFALVRSLRQPNEPELTEGQLENAWLDLQDKIRQKSIHLVTRQAVPETGTVNCT